MPHHGIWQRLSRDGDAERRLRARVARVGGAGPGVAADLDRRVYRPGEPIRVRVTVGRGRAFLALFAWQADGSVVRITPLRTGSAIPVDAGTRLDLPGPDEPEVAAAPMPGRPDSLEAVVLVAATMPFDPADLAPAMGSTADDSRRAAVSADGFLDAVAGLDLARIRLRILPYRVQASR